MFASKKQTQNNPTDDANNSTHPRNDFPKNFKTLGSSVRFIEDKEEEDDNAAHFEIRTMKDDLEEIERGSEARKKNETSLAKRGFFRERKNEDAAVKKIEEKENKDQLHEKELEERIDLPTREKNSVQSRYEKEKEDPANRLKAEDLELQEKKARIVELEKHLEEKTKIALPKLPIKQGETMIKKKSVNAVRIAMSVVFASATFLIIFGAYYFWATRQPAEDSRVEKDPSAEIVEREVPVDPVIPKYSAENPNFMTVNTEEDSGEDVRNMITSVFVEMKENRAEDTILEFIPVDKNNNPIAFSRFAYIFGLDIDENILKKMEEEFVLYLYDDAGENRIGLNIGIKKGTRSEVSADLLAEETFMARDWENLFLGETVEKDAGNIIFNSSEYAGNSIRYVNLNENGDLSIDYSILNERLLIATSKRTIRKIMDEL